MCFCLNISHAQNIFYHLLPGFVTAYTWVGLGSDANWTTPENWSTQVAPGPTNTAIFSDACLTNCDPTINTAINIGGVDMRATYAGTITQATGQTILIGSAGWLQAAGNFTGSDAAVTMNGTFNLSGGVYTATSSTWTMSANFTKTAGTLTHSAGQIVFNTAQTITAGGAQFNDVSFSLLANYTQDLAGSSMTVNGDLTLSFPSACCDGGINNGNIDVKGDVTAIGFGRGGSAVIILSGNTNQNVTGTSDSNFPSLTINSTGGTVTLANYIRTGYHFNYLAGTVDASTSTLHFHALTNQNITPGPIQFNHVTFTLGGNYAQSLNSGTMTVNGNLALNYSSACCDDGLNSGTIQAKGNVTFSDYGRTGSAIIVLSGTGNQTLQGATNAKTPSIVINSTGGTVTIADTLNVRGDWTYTAGTVSATGSTLVFSVSNNIVPGTMNYYHVTFAGSGTTNNLQAGTMTIYGVTTMSDASSSPGSISNGSINARGNVIFSDFGKSGSAILNYTGNANTTLTIGASASSLSTTHNVNKTAKTASLSLVANTAFSSAGRNFSVSSGTFNLAGFSFNVNNLITISNGARMLCNGGTATAGTWSILGEISCGSGQGITWTGGAADGLWSSAANWTSNTIPGPADLARFSNAVCAGATCDAQIDSNLSVRGILLDSTYTGTLTQNATRTLTIGVAGYSQAAGTFAGGDSAIVMNGPYSVSGGSYTSTSATWTHSGHLSFTGAPVFAHNNGSVVILGNGVFYNFTASSQEFNNFNFSGHSAYISLTGVIVVLGQLELSDTDGGAVNNFTSGTIEARGPISITNQGKSGAGLILINGTGNQTITSVGNVPSVQVNKASGTLTISGSIQTRNNWTWTAGLLDATTSTISFIASSGATQTITPGSVTYKNLQFAGYAGTQDLNSGTMISDGTVTFADTYTASNWVNNGTISALGDVVLSANGKNGTAILRIEGTGAQSFNGNGGHTPSVVIDKSAGTLTLSGTIQTFTNFTWISGAVDATASTLSFVASNGSSQTFTPGSVIYNNISFGGYAGIQDLNGGTLIVTGNLTFADGYYASNFVNNGTIEARGNIYTSSNGKNGDVLLKINGTGAQLLSSSGGTVPRVEVDKASGTLSFSGTISTHSDFTWLNGSLSAGTSTLSLTKGSAAGTTQIFTPSNVIYNNVYFGGYGTTQDLNGGTLVATGTITFADTYSTLHAVNNGTIEAQGPVVFNVNGKAGNAILNYSGTSSTTLTRTTGVSALTTTHVVNKSGGGSLQLASDTSFIAPTSSQHFSITSGTLDLNTYDFSTQGTLTIAVGAILKCNGGEFTAGTLSNSGTVNCPGYSTYDFNWTGAGGNTFWNNAGNWQGGVVPGAGDIVAFQDSTCGGTCVADINVNSSVRGVRMYGAFTGTINQNAGSTLTVGARSWSQLGGTFNGGDSNITVNLPAVSGKFSVTGGVFNSTTANLRIARGNHQQGNLTQVVFEIGASATFNHNNGTLYMNCTETWNGNSKYGIDVPTSLTLYNLRFKADGGIGNGHYIASGDTVTVLNDFTLETGLAHAGGFIDLHGNLLDGSSGSGAGARAVVRFKGTGSQTYGYNGTSRGVKILVDKASGSLTASTANVNVSTLTVTNGSITAPTGIFSIGVSGYNEPGSMTLMTLASPSQLIDNGGTLQFFGFDDWNALYNYTYNFGGALTVSNAQFIGYGNSTNIIGGGSSLIVTGTTTHTSGILQGSLIAQGHVAFNSSVRGSATFQFTGSGTQNVSGSYPTTGHWTVNKSGGSLTLSNAFNLSGGGQNLTVTGGTVVMSGYNLTVANNISNSGVIDRGLASGSCGILSQGGAFSGNAPICSP